MPYQFNASAYAAIRIEEPDAVAQLRADAIQTYKPINSQELRAIELLAVAQAEMFRCGILNAGFQNAFMNECMRPGGLPHNMVQPELAYEVTVTATQNRALCLAVGFERLFRESDSFKLYVRYRDQCRRELRESTALLHRLIRLRKHLGADPDFQIPELPTPEVMPQPSPDSEAASPYDGSVSGNLPVRQTIIPKMKKVRRRTAARPTSPEEPRFAGYPKGDEVPEPIRTYGRPKTKPPGE